MHDHACRQVEVRASHGVVTALSAGVANCSLSAAGHYIIGDVFLLFGRSLGGMRFSTM